MYGEKDGRCVECQCGCHEAARKNWVTISNNFKTFGLEGLHWAFWIFVVFCLFGGLSRL